MTVIYKKTTELTESNIKEICEVFEHVFEGVKKPIKHFKNEFLNTCLGYSWHGLLLDESGKIVGANTFVPFRYIIDGEEKLCVMSCDTMISVEHRNFDNILNLITDGRNKMRDEGFYMYFGFPNENSYPLYKKAFRDKEIGNLSIYILPYRIGGIKPKLRLLNPLSMLFANSVLFFSHLSQSKKITKKLVVRDRKSFLATRYKWFESSEYVVCDDEKKNLHFAYRIREYEGVKCAFLFDIYPLCKKNIDRAMRKMFRQDKKNFDMAMFVGYLDFSPYSLIKVPTKYEPKTFHFVGALLDKKFTAPEGLFDVKNWEVDLASYDLV